MTTNLLIHNILFLGGGILNILLAITILYIRRHKIDMIAIMFALMTLSVSVFQISQVLGVMASDAESSRQIFMWNLCVIFIMIFIAHWIFIVTGIMEKKKWILVSIYASGLTLFFIHVIFPETYLLPSVPKMYLPFYYEPGSLQWITRTWFHITGAYYFWLLYSAYKKELDPVKKSRFLFLLLATIYGFMVGETAVFLVYDVPFDPMWSSLFGVYTFLVAYTIVRYKFLDLKALLKRASIYSLATVVLVLFIVMANYGTSYFQSVIPGFPSWIMPTFSATAAVILGVFLSKKFREEDEMKYEFITVIAHKFRTPLTQAKWSAEELMSKETDENKIKNLRYIKEANEKLVNLTSTLIEMSDEKGADVSYRFKVTSLNDLLRTISASLSDQISKKNIDFKLELPVNDIFISADADRLSFVFQTLIENAITYTGNNGKIVLALTRSQRKAYVSISDNGIGIAKADLPKIFAKFYRTHLAQNTDTEGFGVGLYLSKNVVDKHSGTIDVYSLGEGKGTTFTVTLPTIDA